MSIIHHNKNKNTGSSRHPLFLSLKSLRIRGTFVVPIMVILLLLTLTSAIPVHADDIKTKSNRNWQAWVAIATLAASSLVGWAMALLK